MNNHVNISRLKAVATILSGFRDEIVFVGGATVSLYASRPELTTIRVTDDVDVVVELISTGEFYRLQEKLISLGFQHDTNAPIIKEEVLSPPDTVRTYLLEKFNELSNRPLFEEALLGHVEQQGAIQRVKRIKSLLSELH